MKRHWIPILCLALPAAALFAQEQAAPPKPDPAAGRLTDALLHYKQIDDLVVKAGIEHKGPEAQVMGGGAVVIRQFGVGGTGGEPFEGEVEAWRDAKGEICILSKKDLPGFRMFLGLDRTVNRITFEDERPSLGRLAVELGAILDGERFVRFVRNAELKATIDEASGESVFAGKLSRKLVPAGAGGELSRFMRLSKVMRVEARLVVTKEGRFREISLKVVRTDPTSSLRQLRVGLGPGGQPQLEPEEGKKKKEVEGGSTTYTLSFAQGQPSERARVFKRSAKRLIETTGEE